jgi:hypothetical protein
MFKHALAPALLITIVATAAALALFLYRTRSDGGSRLDRTLAPSRLTYDDARAKLLGCTRWHLTDSRVTASCFVTREPRQSRELENVVLVQDRPDPSQDRRGVVRLQRVRGPTTKVVLDEGDTSYWCVVGEVHLAGDPAMVREVAAYLAADSDP